MISPESIRSELYSGKKKGEYRTQDGKWFLSDEEAEGQTVVAEPSAPNQDEEGGDTHAAALDTDPSG